MNRQKGFTLVELLVVITVIGILVALAVPNMNRLKIKAKEVKVMNGAHVIQTALSDFASSHDGLYPGLAVPSCERLDVSQDNPGQEPFFVNGDQDYFSMRALVGGGVVKPQDVGLDFLDGFYFRVADLTNPNGPRQVPDRLVGDGELEIYPENAFRTNIRGITDQAIPMLNIFGIEFQDYPVNYWDPDAPWEVFEGDPAPVRLCETMWYGLDNNDRTLTLGGIYDFPPMGGIDVRFMGDINNRLRYDYLPDENPDFRATRSEVQQTGFSEGNFAYIPLDPVQTDPTAPDFMRYCRNYWLVIYGSNQTAQRNRYADVYPQFPRPLGDGIPLTFDDDDTREDKEEKFRNESTGYEWTARMALVGAMTVIATKYEDQIRVEGS